MGALLDFALHERFGRQVVTIMLASEPGYSLYTYPMDCGSVDPLAFGFAHDLEHAETIYEMHTGQSVDVRWTALHFGEGA